MSSQRLKLAEKTPHLAIVERKESSFTKMHFSTDYIDQLLANVSLVDVMKAHGVKVKIGSAKNDMYIADFCCGKSDYDNGRIKKKTQTFKCESCGAYGNAIHFLTRYSGKTFQEAIVELAEMAGMDLPEKTGEDRKHLALKLAAEFYHKQENYDYFLSRGISLDVLKKYKAGYAPGGRSLRNHLEQLGFTKEELTEFKLLNKKGLDKFFYRAIIPIYMNGRVVDFYGRAINDENAGVKHLYLYGDSNFLGGYDFLVSGLVTIFESFIDQLVAETHGNANGTNTGGANKFSKEHAKLLKKRGATKGLILFDGDPAGQEGAYNAAEILQAEGLESWIGYLPEGEDPADLITKKGMEDFKSSIETKPFREVEMFNLLSQYTAEEIQKYLEHLSNKEGTSHGEL
ncbi:toprim domain-containing protein [Paenibacillus sp. FSL P2-0536]|uniref:toprim domain-containing protein n=1 Tax=Paenibacillus sp. FSL P2-0536 TaxID=2921629 RepID=UPI0030FA4672